MPTWGAINDELNKLLIAQKASGSPPDPFGPSSFDQVRRKYLAELSRQTGRPVIVYASSWLEGRPVADPSLVGVSTRDVMGFMEAVHGLKAGLPILRSYIPGLLSQCVTSQTDAEESVLAGLSGIRAGV